MSYELTWDFSYNTTPTDQSTLTQQCRSFWMQFKNYLVATAGWAVDQSSDSSSTSASDLWDTLSKLVAGSSAHSWIVLKSPIGLVAGPDGSSTGDQSRLWLTINLSDPTYFYLNLKLQITAPVGGTISSAPNAPVQCERTIYFNRSSLNPNAKFHFASTSTGHFIAMLGYLGAGFVPFTCSLFKLVDLTVIGSTGYNYPYGVVFFTDWTDSGTGTFTASYLIGGGGLGFNFDASACASVCFSALGGGSAAWIGAGFQSTGDAINGKHIDSPIWIVGTTTNKFAKWGRVADVFGSGVPTQQGSVDAASVGWCRVGSVWLPSDVAIVM